MLSPVKHVATNVDKSRSPLIVPFAILGVLSLLAALAVLFAVHDGGSATAGNSGDAVPVESQVGSSTFVDRGPFGVGVTSLTLPNGAAVEVWYPANPNDYHGPQATYNVKNFLPAQLKALYPNFAGVSYPLGGIANVTFASGRFPLVVFSHGYAGFNTQSSFLTSHLASWGFVVAAPEHVTRDLSSVLSSFLGGSVPTGSDVTDLQNTITLMGNQNDSSSSIFHDHLDMSRVGAVGHSAGGAAVEKLAVADPKLKTFVGLAGASYGTFGQTQSGLGASVPKVPGLLMYGTNDKVVDPKGMVAAYDALNQPKRLITVQNAGHLVFADICQLAPGQGGLIGVAKKINLPVPAKLVPLGSDGCFAPDLSPPLAWPAINQAVTAQLRWAMGFDATQAGLEKLSATYPSIIGVDTTAPTAP